MNTLKQHIKTNSYERFYLLYGNEAYLKRFYKNKLKAGILGDSDEMNFTYAEGKDIDCNEMIHIAETMPFFSEKRLILLENSGWFKNQSNFADYIREMPESTYVVFVENEVDKRNRLYKAVKDLGYISELNGLDEKSLKIWVVSLLQRENKKITDATLTYFLNKVGTNLDNIQSEIDKLISYCYEREVITEEDIREVCSEQITGKMFQMLDSIAIKNQKRALELYYDLLSLREKPMTILYLLNRHINLLMQCKALLAKRNSNTEIASKMGVPPFAVTKYAAQARNFSEDTLKKSLILGTEIEEQVKTGKLIDQIGVEVLIIKTVLG
ncbi:DNA polymerase III subunit delta [Lachnoclostridium phytofermentans]|nr:DNA polymerase III subunit delta [Lachnoclostridium phytofermentans]